jgi:hypothetical protein
MTAVDRLSRRIAAIVGGHGFVTLSVGDAREILAQAIEAQRAETENTGSVHESAVPTGCAPEQSCEGIVRKAVGK